MIRCFLWCVLLTALSTTTVAAQQRPLTVIELGQMAKEVVRVVVPPDEAMSGVRIANRGVVFDYSQTLAAFGLDTATPRAAFLRTVAIEDGSEGLLADCNSLGSKPCAKLGNRVYVRLSPVTIGDTTAKLLVVVSWVDRPSNRASLPSQTAKQWSFLVGFAREIYLKKTAAGVWTFNGLGATITG